MFIGAYMFLTLYRFQAALTKTDPDLEKKILSSQMASLSKSVGTELLRSTHLVALRGLLSSLFSTTRILSCSTIPTPMRTFLKCLQTGLSLPMRPFDLLPKSSGTIRMPSSRVIPRLTRNFPRLDPNSSLREVSFSKNAIII